MVTRKLWRDAKVPVVVDATALDWLSAEPLPRDVVRVITPHPGEAARLLKTTNERIQGSRVESLREISKRFGDCWVVLKGHQTLIGRSSGAVFVNSSGNPHLAQGGSGDALAGFVAGLLTQTALQTDIAKTIAYAVHEHGAAADRLCARQRNWMVEDLVRELGNAP
jgi:NAD(P)H-hydrate epimerase